MTEPTDQKQIQEWIEQYVNNTISPEAAEQLLEIVQNDPEKLDALCSQLQTDCLLENMEEQNQQSMITEVVLERVKEMNRPMDRANVRRSRIFLKIAASLAVLFGLSSLLLPYMAGRTDRAEEVSRKAKQEVAEANRAQMRPADSDSEGITTAVASQKPKVEATSSTQKERSSQADERMRLKVVQPKPLFAGTPVKVVSDHLELVPSPAPAPAARSDSLTQGVEQYRKGDLAKAETSFEAVLGQDPYNREAMDYLKQTAQQLAYSEVTLHEASRAPALSSVDQTWNPAEPTQPNRENYATIVENEFNHTSDKTLSTFSIDVDTASYANVRRYLKQGKLPPANAVRIEEMVNYFDYNYQAPGGNEPFSTSMALTSCPWNEDHQLLRVGLQGRKLAEDDRRDSNLVFLLDVSGSMKSADKLPLLKKGFEKMVRALGEKDRVAIVVYAGSSGVVLDSTSAMEKETIIGAMNRLKAGGSTAGGQGIELAYRLASDHFSTGGVNRVVLATDGDFNVGISDINTLQRLIEEKRKSGVFLSVLGFGTGNLQDAKMEMLANKGNGNYFYIDSEREAEKVLVRQLTANMVTIAKDVKIQVEFNPMLVRSYRLIGYENRKLAARDFNDDTKDAGEIGAGHQVTALYELVPIDAPATEDGVPLKYTKPAEPKSDNSNRSELLTLKLRYKEPAGSTSRLQTFTLAKDAYKTDAMDESFRWATSIAAFGMHLRNSNQISSFSMDRVVEFAKGAMEHDPHGYRAECLELMIRAANLKSGNTNTNDYPQWQFRN